jgi:hypothetical protein
VELSVRVSGADAVDEPGSRPRAQPIPTKPVEAGLAGIDVSSWQGGCAPAATPPALLDKLNTDIDSVLRTPEIQQRIEELVMVRPQTAREEFDQFIRAEIVRGESHQGHRDSAAVAPSSRCINPHLSVMWMLIDIVASPRPL